MKKIAITIDKGEYCVSTTAGNVRLVSNDILKVYAEITQLVDSKLKSECDFKDLDIKKDILAIDEIVKTSKRFLKNYKHIKKAAASDRPTTQRQKQLLEPQQQSRTGRQQPKKRPRLLPAGAVKLCIVSNSYRRNYLNSDVVNAIIKSKLIKLPDGKTNWEYLLYCDGAEVRNSKSIIAEALPKRNGIPMMAKDRPLEWLGQ